MTGDVSSHDEAFPFSVECKCQEKWRLEMIVEGRCAWFTKCWKQCVDDAIKGRKIPMLVFTRNWIGDYVAIPEIVWVELTWDRGPDWRAESLCATSGLHSEPFGDYVRIMTLDRMTQFFSPEIMEKKLTSRLS
jgi:hypothetical protein